MKWRLYTTECKDNSIVMYLSYSVCSQDNKKKHKDKVRIHEPNGPVPSFTLCTVAPYSVAPLFYMEMICLYIYKHKSSFD